MPRFHWNLKQGTVDWYNLRLGIPTASEFDKIITPKKGELASARHKYACRLISERLLNWQADSLEKIDHIAAGKENEPFAVAQLELTYDFETRPVGFVTSNDGRFGASPDRVAEVAADLMAVGTVIECKCPTIPKQMEYLLLGHDDAYRCQVQGQLYVAEADKAIFYAYSQRMPAYRVESGRDDAFIKRLADGLEQFSDELEEMTERAKRLGAFQAFEQMKTPVDAELGEDQYGGHLPPEEVVDRRLADAVPDWAGDL